MFDIICTNCYEDYGSCECVDVQLKLFSSVSDVYYNEPDEDAIFACPAQSPQVEKVNIENIHPIQEHLETARLAELVDKVIEVGWKAFDPGPEFVRGDPWVAVDATGKLVLADGHHRVAALILCGAAEIKIWVDRQ